MLVASFVRIIVAYTNVELGGSIDDDKDAWLAGELHDADVDAVILTTIRTHAIRASTIGVIGRLRDETWWRRGDSNS